MANVLKIIRKLFDVKLAPDEVIHVTLVQIRAL